MKTHLFKINHLQGKQKVKDILKYIEGRSTKQKNKTVGGFVNRIEELQFQTINGADCALVNFVKLRMEHGPGKGGISAKTKGFDLQDDEGFSEETAALFDFDSGHVIVEYNHHGARATVLCLYLALLTDNVSGFEFLPCLDDTVIEQLANLEILSKIEVKLAPKKIDPDDKKRVRSIESALDFAEVADAPSITITLGGLPGNSATLGESARQLVTGLLKILKADEKLTKNSDRALKTLKVIGKEDEYDPSIALDLIRGKVCGVHDVVAGPDRRLPIDGRWRALKKDRKRWDDIIQ